jgi:hypothetical protein
MDKVFVAHWFGETDRQFVTEIEQILASYDVFAVTGKVLGGDAIDDGVREKIGQCDGLVALATRRTQIEGKELWNTHPWVIDEFNYADAQRKRTIAIVETDVVWQGMHANREHVPLDRVNSHLAFWKLSQTIALWKREAGRRLKVQLLPKKIKLSEAYTAEYCFFEFGKQSAWFPTALYREEHGIFAAYIYKVVRDTQLITVRVSKDGRTWTSAATAQFMPITI